MQVEAKPKAAGTKRALMSSAVGYGIVCGLTFPLMISSTFLQEMSLSHGAGNAFGSLFFLAYALTMAGTALAYALRRKPTHRMRILSAFVTAFLGNALMFARLVGLIEGGWLYAIAAASLIGYGLATAELAWMARITSIHERGEVSLARAVPLAFLCGGVVAAIIFAVSGTFELLFALTIIVVSAIPLVRTSPLDASARRVSLAQGSVGDFVKAVSYLAVFSFVFGAVSQVATVVEEPIPIATQAVLGILLAAGIMLLYVVRKKHALSVGDLYDILFPIVAVALIALPFITSPIVHVIASVLVFVAFYLSGMNVRIAVCLLGERDRVSMWVYLSVALGASALLILAGVAFGAAVIAQDLLVTGLALISLVSLFVLALNPIVVKRLEGRRMRTDTPSSPTPETGDVRARQVDLLRLFAEAHHLTARETEVLILLCQGRTRTYIADELGLSPNTIKGYIHNVYQKSGAVDKQDLLDRVELHAERR